MRRLFALQRATAAVGAAGPALCSPFGLTGGASGVLTRVGSRAILSVASSKPTPQTDDPASTQAELAAALLLDVKGRAPLTGYDCAQFGESRNDADRNGCDQRKDALFHLASRKGEGGDELAAVYDKLPPALKKDVIFHIAQRRDGPSLDKLISIAKSNPSMEMRKEALFHPGQSKDPRALKARGEIGTP